MTVPSRSHSLLKPLIASPPQTAQPPPLDMIVSPTCAGFGALRSGRELIVISPYQQSAPATARPAPATAAKTATPTAAASSGQLVRNVRLDILGSFPGAMRPV